MALLLCLCLVNVTRAQGRGRFPRANRLLAALDLNGDGQLTEEEIRAAAKSLKTLDRDEDGELTSSELGSPTLGRPGSGGTQRLSRAGLKVGDPLPKLTVFDARGREFPLGELKGDYTVLFAKGAYFDKRMRPLAMVNDAESPLADPLRSIGFGPDEVNRILHQFCGHLIQQWSDVTLAAVEEKGPSFFKRSPQAYFMYNIQKAASGARTPPDWWLDLRKSESRVQAKFGGQNAKARICSAPTSVGDVLDTLIDGGAVPVAQARAINS